ncbi:hypothetical protein H6H01_19315 [Nostoc calcicola FACHB-3891]|nr:hypothetical protein [Nostoc calcicola FACHB-3891]
MQLHNSDRIFVCGCDRLIISTTSFVIFQVNILVIFFVKPNQDKVQESAFSESC